MSEGLEEGDTDDDEAVAVEVVVVVSSELEDRTRIG